MYCKESNYLACSSVAIKGFAVIADWSQFGHLRWSSDSHKKEQQIPAEQGVPPASHNSCS